MDLNSLIAECTAYDFKVMLEEKKPKSWLKSVSTFAFFCLLITIL
jgi:ATP-dependent DNA helicase RecG